MVGIQVGDAPTDSWTITKKVSHLLTENLYRKNLEVENFISDHFNNDLYVSGLLMDLKMV